MNQVLQGWSLDYYVDGGPWITLVGLVWFGQVKSHLLNCLNVVLSVYMIIFSLLGILRILN